MPTSTFNEEKVRKVFDEEVTVPDIKQGKKEAVEKLINGVLGKKSVTKDEARNLEKATAILEYYEKLMGTGEKEEKQEGGKRAHYQRPPNPGRAPGHNIQFVLKGLAQKDGISKKEIAEGLNISSKAAQSLVQDCRNKGALIHSEAGRWSFTDENEVTVDNYRTWKKERETRLANGKK